MDYSALANGGQFTLVSGGQFEWFFHIKHKTGMLRISLNSNTPGTTVAIELPFLTIQP
jgi:hypothetical protein